MVQHIPAFPQDVEDHLTYLLATAITDADLEAVKVQIKIEAQRFREELYDAWDIMDLDDQVNHIINILG